MNLQTMHAAEPNSVNIAYRECVKYTRVRFSFFRICFSVDQPATMAVGLFAFQEDFFSSW